MMETLDLVRRAARAGVLLGAAGDRLQAVNRAPSQSLAAELRRNKIALLPLLLPTNPQDWPVDWRDLLAQRVVVDQEVYELTCEAAAFVSEGWIRLAHARLAANSPPLGEPWADLALDDLMLAAMKDHRTREE